MNHSRRRTLFRLAALGAATAIDGAGWQALLEAAAPLPAIPGGRLLRVMPLGRLDRDPTPPLNTLLGEGLDARQFTDISGLDDDRLITPTAEFYVRTAPPASLPPPAGWRLALGGVGADDRVLTLDALLSAAEPMGVHLMECSGNADPANFGLISAAAWDGVPMTWILERLGAPGSARIRVSGLDHEARTTSSLPGADWVFTADALVAQRAFLATHMNGTPLTPVHGAPVRLVVPNYYGCSCIKWVARIDAVPGDVALPAQMREFSLRTHQTGVPVLARDYEPPLIDLAAAPIRVEQWQVDDGQGRERIVYRVVGIRWGGTSAAARLVIRFGHRERFVPVEHCPDAPSTTTWSLWTHIWRPASAGRYQIALQVEDPKIRTRRLDMFYYTRDVNIDRV